MLGLVVNNAAWQSRFFRQLQQYSQRMTRSRQSYMLLALVQIGFIVLGLLAYAPADGADGSDYYVHAAFLAGYDVPATFEAHPPVYPILINLFFYQMKNIQLLLILQVGMRLAGTLLLYASLRPYSPLLAFAIALVVSADMQTQVVFNFTATEPAYMFLLIVAFALLLFQLNSKSKRATQSGDIGLAVVLVLAAYTRSVGRYLLGPFALVFLLKTRSLKRTAILLIAYVVVLQGFIILYQWAFKIERVQAGTQSDGLLMQPLTRSGLLDKGDGTASEQIVPIISDCTPPYSVCVYEAQGRQAGQRLIRDAYIEMVRAHPVDYVIGVLNNITDFLSLSGLQFSSASPAQAQCDDVEARAEMNYVSYLEGSGGLVVGDVEVNEAVFREVLAEQAGQLCPPWPESEIARSVVDWIGWRYRSLARPTPWIWYGGLFVLMGLIPVMRRFWPVGSAALFITVYHAGMSALIYNVQPRYAVVTNPFRAILLLLVVYIVLHTVLRIFDEYLVRRHQ